MSVIQSDPTSSALIIPETIGSRSVVPAGLNIYTPSVPGHLSITDSMIEDFLVDPVAGAQVLLGERLDEFQKVRLKVTWWFPRVMDSSGFSSAKTKGMWIASVLRCLLIGDHVGLVAYPVFATGQQSYWKYFSEVAARSSIFRAQVGRRRIVGLDGKSEEEGKATLKGPSCWTCDFRNASQIMMPAVGFLQDARTMASLRINDLWIDEHTKAEATGSTGIDDQLVQRATRACFNKEHPIWCNHQFFAATAEDTMHPSYERYKSFYEEVQRGNPDYALISFCFKDYSDLEFVNGKTFRDVFREDKVIRDIKKNKSAAGFRQEALGLWSKNGKGWYTEDMIDAAILLGKERKLEPILSRLDDPQRDKTKRGNVHFFFGVDPAKADTKKADDGAIVGLRAEPRVAEPGPDPRHWRLDFVWAYAVRKADASQWAAKIHQKHLAFQLTRIMMDPNGGGQWIRPEMAKPKQIIRDREVKVKPIARIEDEETMMSASFILAMFKRGDARMDTLYDGMDMRGEDNLYDHAHDDLREGLANIGIPPKIGDLPAEIIATWSEEKRWAHTLLSKVLPKQLKSVCVQTNDDGTTFFSNHNARLFSARGKKDFAYAALYAYIAFLSWLKTYDAEAGWETEQDDEVGCF